MGKGVDYSFARPGGAAIRAAGYEFVCRYLASSSGKRISVVELQDLQGNSLGIVLVFEDYANQALNGQAQGVADAQEALGQANALGFPSDRPIYFAVDFDAADTPLQNNAIYAYLDGAASVIGANRVGVYGGFYVVKRCMENGKAAWGWQTIAWSGGQVYDGAHIYQNGGSDFNGGCDINVSMKADYGQWGQGQVEVQDVMDTNDGIEAYRVAFHREPESTAAAEHWNGRKFSDIANTDIRGGFEWQAIDAKLSDYPNQVQKVSDLTTQLTDAQAAQAKAEADLKALQDQTNTDTDTGNSFLRWLGGILSKLKGSK